MNTQTAMAHLAAYREGKVTDPRLSKALRCIEKEEAQKGVLAEQVAFDQGVMEMLSVIRSPDDLRQRLTVAQPPAATTAARPRHQLTAVVAVALGVAIIFGVLWFLHLQGKQNFTGRDTLTNIARNQKAGEMEVVKAPAGELGDWFYIRGFDRFQLPAELRGAPAEFARIFRYQTHKVAQIIIDHESRKSLICLLREEDFTIALPSDEWTIFAMDDWAAAARKCENCIAMISFPGNEAEMKEFLSTLKP